jgi:hypothetical protein
MELIHIRALAALIDERVEAKLVALGIGTIEYTTGVRPAVLPAGVTQRTFDRWCRDGPVEGAEHDGPGWRCTATAWRTARSAAPRRVQAPERSGVDYDADAMLRGAGLRRTR